MNIEITCDGSDFVDFKKLIPFQGDLKRITDKNLDKLKKSIIKYGFTTPAFVWKNKDKKYILDAHQRMKALESLFSEGYAIPDIPVVYVQAKSKKEAKEKLLHITSQYGDINRSGFADFVLDAKINLNELNMRLVDKEFKISEVEDTNKKEPFDWDDDDDDGDDDDVSIMIIIPKEHKSYIIKWLANGHDLTSPGFGKGVIELSGCIK